MSIRLLLDAYSTNSPGARLLRDGLIDSILEQRPEGATLVCARSPSGPTIEARDGLTVVVGEEPSTSLIGQWRWYNHGVPRICSEENIDVVFSLYGLTSKRVTDRYPTIASLNNILAFSKTGLDSYPMLSKTRFRVLLQKWLLRSSLRRADAYLFFSHHLIDVLSDWIDGISSRSTAVLYGIPADYEFDFDPPPPHPFDGRNYILYLSAVYPYKNHVRLIAAYAEAVRKDPSIPDLFIAGIPADPGAVRKMTRAIERADLGSRVAYLGKIELELIPAAIHHATFNIFPSLCEVSSLVVVETISAGAALACTRPNSPLDIEGGYACEPFDPLSVEEMTRTILELSNDESRREELRVLARRRASELSWDDSGIAVWDIAQSLLESRRQGSPTE